MTVANDGLQDAGTLNIQADKIIIENGGQITAATANGAGGNIVLTSKVLGLTGNSNITTNARGPGDGGRITLNSDFIAAPLFQDNNISANAADGDGGRIDITTLGLLGIAAADEDLPTRNDITATSETGLSGTVAIQNFDIDPFQRLDDRPTPLTRSKLLTTTCLAATYRQGDKNRFTADNKRGGLPADPQAPFNMPLQTYTLPPTHSTAAEANSTASDPEPLPFEANGIYRLSDGRITLGRRCG